MQIYIHIPFCRAKCKYCAFNSIVAENNLIEKYVSALCIEIEKNSSFEKKEKISTIYIGGGTPSILKINQFAKIFDTLNKNFNLSECNEITVEVNPGTVNEFFLRELKNLRVNRLSIGVQSFDNNVLKTIGRIHNSNEAIEIVNAAKNIFENVSIDLMYELPNQNLKILCSTIETAIKLNPKHISIYELEIEEGTEFFRRREELNLPNDDEGEEMYNLITNELPKHGFNRYEISNFAKRGFESRHNLGYWSDEKYFGLGAGAHSYNHSLRWSNVKNVNEYIEKIFTNEEIKIVEEILTKEKSIEEFCFLSLRKSIGINKKLFRKKFGVEIEKIYSKKIDMLIRQELIKNSNEHIKLTERGMKYGNYVFAEFLLVDMKI